MNQAQTKRVVFTPSLDSWYRQ